MLKIRTRKGSILQNIKQQELKSKDSKYGVYT